MLDLRRIPEAIEHQGGVSRRLFMGYLASLAAIPLLGSRAEGKILRPRAFAADPFSLGLASGDPDSTSVVLWTRLAPDSLAPDGGMAAEHVEVSWELAEDEGMKKVIKKGTATASKDLAHSVHVEVDGLAPDRWYWYRFRSGDAETKVGRTRTLPDANVMPDSLKFAFASCQNYEMGYYTAYDHMSRDDLDLVFFLGDYIYEAAPRKNTPRSHSPVEAGKGPLMTLADYRLRHGQYRSDPMLQAAHARCPWFVTPDDHEVANDYANDHDNRPGLTSARFLERRAGAYQTYYEMMPLRARSLPKGPDMQLYRGAAYGRLADLHVLDTRQFRSVQPHGDKGGPLDFSNPDQTIMGAAQKTWLKDRLAGGQGTWNLIANQVMMGMLRRHPADHPGEDVYSSDSWTGYAAERIEIVKFMGERKVKNPVIITGDVHANYVNDLRADDRETDKPIIAAEFVGTSITSAGDGEDQPKGVAKLMSDNAGLRYHNRERGYVRCTMTPKLCTADYVTVAKVSEKGAPLQNRASFVVEAGVAGIKKA